MASSKTKQRQHNDQLSEEYLSAQQAAANAISLSHTTLSTTLQQEEQLQHCQNLMERQKYIYQKSARLVRGLTWSGWVANVFSKDVSPPPMEGEEGKNLRRVLEERRERGELSQVISSTGNGTSSSMATTTNAGDGSTSSSSEQLQTIELAIQNYHCNLLLLKQCDTSEQFYTCIDVCQTLYTSTKQAIDNSTSDNRNIQRPRLQKFQKRLEELQIMEKDIVQSREEEFKKDNSDDDDSFHNTSSSIPTGRKPTASYPSSSSNSRLIRNQRAELYENIACTNSTESITNPKFTNTALPTNKNNDNSILVSDQYKNQEQHLDILASNLEELQYMGKSIGTSLQQQNEMLDVMDNGVEDLVEQSKMVVRRADRVSSMTKWTSPKPEFLCWIAIQHVPTKKYLCVQPQTKNYQLSLDEVFQSDASIFGVYSRRERKTGISTSSTSSSDGGSSSSQTTVLGLKNKCTNRWLGQTLFGSVVCSASKFGRREEWELDDGIMLQSEEFELNDAILHTTRILCCCANWGNGGWLEVKDVEKGHFNITGFELESKRSAPFWSIVVLNEDGTVDG